MPEKSIDTRADDLYGIWKDSFPKDFDIDTALREVRGEWQKEMEEIGSDHASCLPLIFDV